MSLGSHSASKHLALVAGLLLGMALGSSAVADPSDDGLQGMTGSNGRGMTGSNGRGMTGSNGRGMTGSNGRGMTGSNGRGMTGSNGRGMTGSNGRGMTGSNGRAYAAAGFGAGFETAAMGTVDVLSVDGGAAAIVVAGQSFQVSAEDVRTMSVGDYVVAASVEPKSLAVVYPVGVPYVAGVSAVKVKASVTTVDPTRGTLSAGDLSIDYTAHLAAGATTVMSAAVPGDTVEAAGVRPATNGVLLIDSSGDGLRVTASDRR